ncbi:MAG: class I SAM-dependent methyltransferase [Bdellovibrionales bacterium]|nr:class I SAM-dependent methyltransferase [Bdellovibrionales bacterium]
MFKEIKSCRICQNKNLIPVVNLGNQMLTGVFPKEESQKVTVGPLVLVKCYGENSCGLLQLKHTYNLEEMYGLNYGYRSGLNQSMVTHLTKKVQKIIESISLSKGDLVIDIGSNDGTTLRAYPLNLDLNLVGVDPTGIKFAQYYPNNAQLIPNFFSPELIKELFPKTKAKIVTSFSMFYDLENPMQFMQDIFDILDESGVWVFEQSYMPTMLKTNSYDTICHEHLEFYGLSQIKWMTDKIGFKIIDVEFNDINGGSFSVTVQKNHADLSESSKVRSILDSEKLLKLDTITPYISFQERIEQSKRALIDFLNKSKLQGKKVAALGASTKGNVILQYCNIKKDLVSFVGEVNFEKFQCYTPGVYLPIIEENQLLQKNCDYLLILPWHFKNFFISNKKFSGINLVFPLPEFHIVRP